MRYSLLLASALLLATNLAFAGGPLTGRAGNYTVSLVNQPATPIVGSNQLLITVKDGDKPLAGAGVDVHLDMTEMSMPADVKATPGKKDGEYVADVNLSMKGQWKISVNVQQMAGMKMDGDGKADFTLQVGKKTAVSSSAAAPAAPAAPATPAPTSLPLPWSWMIVGTIIIIVAIIIIGMNGKRQTKE